MDDPRPSGVELTWTRTWSPKEMGGRGRALAVGMRLLGKAVVPLTGHQQGIRWVSWTT